MIKNNFAKPKPKMRIINEILLKIIEKLKKNKLF